ncbi:hypothetical protein AB0I10_34085 [Streptomyces sp. NPDC050636]|uniref:hypothetical protein n=1 Tax=Streptomyces sp. NPDC050636 TaxID=3154510 RepID=UPI003423316B
MNAGKKITEKLSDEALRTATGRDWKQWFTILDTADATTLTHTAIARLLVESHGVDGWYAQSITVGYEQERGLRVVGQSSTGEFRAGVSHTIDAPAAELFAAFDDPGLRHRWLPGDGLTED